MEGGLCQWSEPEYATHVLYTWGIEFKTAQEDGFCKYYIKLYKIKMTKNLGDNQIK